MKIILLQNVPKIGKKREVRNVADGYARNFLIPQGLARMASSQAIEHIERLKKADEETWRAQKELLKNALAKVDGEKIAVTAKANEKGHLFAGLGKEEISVFLKKQGYRHILPEHIVLEAPLKEIGEHEIGILTGGADKTAKFILKIEREGKQG